MKKLLIGLTLLGGGTVVGAAANNVFANANEAKVQANYNNLLTQYKLLSAQYKTAQEQKELILAMITQVEGIVADLEIKISDLEEENDKLMKDVDTLDTSLKTVTGERDELLKEKASLQKQVNDLLASNSTNESLISSLRGQIETLNGTISSKNQAIAELEGTVSDLNNTIITKDAAIDRLTVSNKNYKKQMEALSAELIEKNTEISKLNLALASTQKELKALETAYDKLAKENEDLKETNKELEEGYDQIENAVSDLLAGIRRFESLEALQAAFPSYVFKVDAANKDIQIVGTKEGFTFGRNATIKGARIIAGDLAGYSIKTIAESAFEGTIVSGINLYVGGTIETIGKNAFLSEYNSGVEYNRDLINTWYQNGESEAWLNTEAGQEWLSQIIAEEAKVASLRTTINVTIGSSVKLIGAYAFQAVDGAFHDNNVTGFTYIVYNFTFEGDIPTIDYEHTAGGCAALGLCYTYILNLNHNASNFDKSIWEVFYPDFVNGIAWNELA